PSVRPGPRVRAEAQAIHASVRGAAGRLQELRREQAEVRHALTRVALVSCVLALAAATGPAGAAGADSTLKPTSRQQANWTKFHFNLGNTGFNPFENVINTSNVSSLVSAWQGVTGTSSTSSPAVVHGVVYVGMDDNKLYAFDAAGVTNCS